MKKKYLAILFLPLLIASKCYSSQYVFDYNDRCHKAYLHYMALNLKQGHQLIMEEIRANPYNLMATYLGDYEDCLLLMMNGDKRDYDQLNNHLESRLTLISRGDETSPWYRLCKAELYFHWALVSIRFGSNFKAATMFRKSFLLLKDNDNMFPSFLQNKIFLGVEEAVIGTIPDEYKWLASIFGMKGSVKKGISQIEYFINNTSKNEALREEAIVYSIYLKYYLLSQQKEMVSFISSDQFPTQHNIFHSFIKANLALNSRNGETALQTLNDAKQEDSYQRFPIFDYEMGCALLNKIDNSSISNFNNFLRTYRGRFFVKDAWQKLSYCYYLQNDLKNAAFARNKILSQGSLNVDADKQAQRFAENTNWPNRALLQVRLLLDGGYYSQALQKIKVINGNALDTENRLEYYFRYGRIYDELNSVKLAKQYYQTTIKLGAGRKEHYAARSALQLGMLNEKAGNITEAINNYNTCLSMKGHDFQSNIDQQAKAGLNRLGQK